MSTVDPGTVLAAGVAAIGVVVWLVRLEGKIVAQSQLYEKLVDDVTYIRSRIDHALNGHGQERSH